jgi:dTDP-4-dehydrorhamnose reductase
MFGWSPSGDRSLAEFFYHHLRRGERVQGFTDVVFNPLLVNDLARILLQVLENELEGLYHIGGPDSWSKYQFGVGIAESFDFDPDLIEPSSIDQAGLKPARGKRLNLCVEKLIHSLGLELPGLSTALERFYTLYQQGYPQKIREMVDYS